ncbi:MAG: M15 family metallopeptidase [Clostridia bacterium]|nr:M15 family metallopeptidase [Clostridia bacterium]
MSFIFGKKSLEKINNPKFHPKLKLLLIEAIKTSPIDFTVLETVRTLATQKEYLKKGTTKTLKSRHIPLSNKSGLCEAVDVAPYPIDWSDKKRFIQLSEHIKKTANKLNIPITWGGDWKTLVDMPHYELKI